MPVCSACGRKVDPKRHAWLVTSDGTEVILCDEHANVLLELIEQMHEND